MWCKDCHFPLLIIVEEKKSNYNVFFILRDDMFTAFAITNHSGLKRFFYMIHEQHTLVPREFRFVNAF